MFTKQLKGKIKELDYINIALMGSVASLLWGLKTNTICIIFLFALVLVRKIKEGRKANPGFRELAIGASLYFVSVLWMLNTDDFSSGISYLERTLSGLVFPLVFFMLGSSFNYDKKLIFIGFIASCFLRYLFFLYQVVELELVFILDYWKEVIIQFNQLSKELDLHPTYFSILLGFASILCLVELNRFKRKQLIILVSFGMVIMNMTLAAKTPFFAFLLIYMYIAVKKLAQMRRGAKKTLLMVFSVLSLFLFSWGFYKSPNLVTQDFFNYYQLVRGEKVSDLHNYGIVGNNTNLSAWVKTNRLYIWQATIESIRENLVFGTGTGDIHHVLNRKYEYLGYVHLANKNTNTHNQLLDFFLRFGLIGFLIITFFTLLAFKSGWGNRDFLYIYFLALVIFSCLTENILNRQMGIVFFHFFNNLFLILNSQAGVNRESLIAS
ncbi:MAG: hypothetical protein CMH48_05725 [Muricauda sp.]|nr:O-antigen ligase family protein [Allomuricauda sp.]MBC30325.1 hypothetical protein [Allomuricauda sp.]